MMLHTWPERASVELFKAAIGTFFTAHVRRGCACLAVSRLLPSKQLGGTLSTQPHNSV